MKILFCVLPSRLGAAGLLLSLAAGCSMLNPKAMQEPTFYSLDSVPGTGPVAAPIAALTLIINPPQAAAGFDSTRIIYLREPHKLEYYAHNEWVDTPARMLEPLILAAIENNGVFHAVVVTPSAATGDLRLDTEIIRLQHDFIAQPSHVRFTLRAYIVNNTTRRVLAWEEFDTTIAATSEDPYGGVIAANLAVQTVLEQLAEFCTTAAGNWKSPADEAQQRRLTR